MKVASRFYNLPAPVAGGQKVNFPPSLTHTHTHTHTVYRYVKQTRVNGLKLMVFVMLFLFLSRRRTANSFSTSPENTEAPSGVCAEVRVPSTALHVFVSICPQLVSLPVESKD